MSLDGGAEDGEGDFITARSVSGSSKLAHVHSIPATRNVERAEAMMLRLMSVRVLTRMMRRKINLIRRVIRQEAGAENKYPTSPPKNTLSLIKSRTQSLSIREK